ncbi:MAG: hypothetical protein M3288_05275 [Thermoproteota archaeon]|nr:hypothetical protein [Thermoproteota archaeon]
MHNASIKPIEAMLSKMTRPLALESSFSVKFENAAGTYDYICEFHPWMTDRMIVQ